MTVLFFCFFLPGISAVFLFVISSRERRHLQKETGLSLAAASWTAMGMKVGSAVDQIAGKAVPYKFQERKRRRIKQLCLLYPGQNPETLDQITQGRKYAWIISIMIAAAVCYGGFWLRGSLSETSSRESLERLPFGSGDYETVIQVEGAGGEQTSIAVTVSEQLPEEAAMQEIFADTLEEVLTGMLGENRSLQEVRSDLNCMRTSKQGIRLRWESQEPYYISSGGKLEYDVIPEEGVSVMMKLRMTYASYETSYEIPLFLLPAEENEETLLARLIEKIRETDQTTRTERFLRLPGEMDGKQLSYSVKKKDDRALYALIAIASVLAAQLPKRQWKEREEERKQQLAGQFISFTTQLSLLVNAGLTIRQAWRTIISERKEKSGQWQKEKKRRKGGSAAIDYLTEEMKRAVVMMENGDGEEKAYRDFGERCGLYAYQRMGSMLAQNLRQGSRKLADLLEEETENALEEFKNEMLRRGEWIGTKMMVPMFLLLGLVMAVLIMPAFMNFGGV